MMMMMMMMMMVVVVMISLIFTFSSFLFDYKYLNISKFIIFISIYLLCFSVKDYH